jgi:tRNA (cmo5U34)-methyltransferase
MERNNEPVAVTTFFGRDQAAGYDERWAKLAPINDALHLFMRAVLQGLPADARILCVGVGTGAELFALAKIFPGWRFTAVDPAEAMLDICRQKARDAGISDRCTFHAGYLDSLPRGEAFDAATAILVSQFLVDHVQRRDFFRQIAQRVRPAGLLVNADLASSVQASDYDSLVSVWARTQGVTAPEAVKAMCAAWGKHVAVLPPKEVEAIMIDGGFEQPILFYQALFIHAWYARAPRG